MSYARRAISKKAVQACGLDTSPCGVPISRMNVPGRLEEMPGPSPRYSFRCQASKADLMAVGP